jgi:hypothetical protein
MNIVLSIDYEIYFGPRSGGAEQTLVEPTQALATLAERHGVPLVVFVDVLWLMRLRELAPRHHVLMSEYYRVARQLGALAAAGHELQLHLHPHWMQAQWLGEGWRLDLARYRLHSFADDEIAYIVSAACKTLRALGDGRSPVSAFRAGGWCIQPFDRLCGPLAAAGIHVDSTVYAGGRQQGGVQEYDFRGAPDASRWTFDHDPLVPVEGGAFLELPIASVSVAPLFYWQLAAAKLLRLPAHRELGDGIPIRPSRGDLARKLIGRTRSVVSMDGMKSNLLPQACDRYRRSGMEDFVVIGHPKALTPHSLKRLDAFLRRSQRDRFVGMEHYAGTMRGARRQARVA